MAIEVRIPVEVTAYKEKIMFGLTGRQLICLICAIAIGVGTYALTSKLFGTDIASYIVILVSAPFLAVGFIEKDGQPFEKYAAKMIRHHFGKNTLSYKTEYAFDIDHVEAETDGDGDEATILQGDNKNGTFIKEQAGSKKAAGERINEYDRYKISKEGHDRKRKEAIREIKAAQQEYRKQKQANY